MFDSATAVQEAAYGALNVAAVTGLGAEVWAHMPEIGPDADPLADSSVVIIHDTSIEPIGGKDGGLDKVTFQIITAVRKPDRGILTQLQGAVREQLEDREIAAFGVLLSRPILTSADSELQEDGQTYIGKQEFMTIVQPL